MSGQLHEVLQLEEFYMYAALTVKTETLTYPSYDYVDWERAVRRG